MEDFAPIVNVDKTVHSIMCEAKNGKLESLCLALSSVNKRSILESYLSHSVKRGVKRGSLMFLKAQNGEMVFFFFF